MSVTTAEQNRVEQLDDPFGSNVREMTSVVTERLLYFRRIATRHLENAADAEDAVQDAFLAAWQHLGRFRGQAQMSTWLTAIVMNKSRTILRKRAHLRFLPIDGQNDAENSPPFAELLPDFRPNPETQLRGAEWDLRLRRLYACLPASLRVVVRMRSVEGMSIRETAQALGLTESAVKSRAYRALTELRRLDRETSRRSLQTPNSTKRLSKPHNLDSQPAWELCTKQT
jgi:RNA polymerase sigma-70 factor (ECF subfamily)